MNVLAEILNAFHIFLLTTPFIGLVLSNKILRTNALLVKILALVIFLIPLHWRFLDNQCALSILSIKLGDSSYNTNTQSPFTRDNMGPIYKPLMKLFKLDWDSDKDLNFMLSIHWVINFVVTWYVLSFKLCKN